MPAKPGWTRLERFSTTFSRDTADSTGDQAFAFIGGTAFTREAGQLRYAAGILAGDTDGDGIADFEIQLTGRPMIDAGHLFL